MALVVMTMIMLNSCSTNDDNSKNNTATTAVTAKTIASRAAASAPGGLVTDLVFVNSTANKIMIISSIGAVARVSFGQPLLNVFCKESFGSNSDQNLNVRPGETVRFTDFVNATVTQTSTAVVTPLINIVPFWDRISNGSIVLSALSNTLALSNHGFSIPNLPANVKYVKWDWIRVFVSDPNATTGSYTWSTTTQGASFSLVAGQYIGVSAGGNAIDASNSSKILPFAPTNITYTNNGNTTIVNRTIVGDSIIVTMQ